MLCSRNADPSDSGAINVGDDTTLLGTFLAVERFALRLAYVGGLLASGFKEKDGSPNTYIPCPLGTVTHPLALKSVCQNCPPGGFYSDVIGYVSKSCMKCPNGSFVAYESTPGKQLQDCKSCPLGTETDFFAGNRACKCLEGHYRTHMFERCFKCGQGGLKCQDDYATLKYGHWWEWRNDTHKDHYNVFIKNLLTSSPAFDVFHVEYPYLIPTPYRCPVEESCKGGLDSPCEIGYQGPLCSICSLGYYKQFNICSQCPSKGWIVTQLSIILAILLIIIVVSVWNGRRRPKRNEKRFLVDTFFSKVKIVVGFYQVTYGLLEVFSYIKWPGSLQTIAKYSGFLQLNLMQIAPVQCLFPGLNLDAFGSLFVTMAMNAAALIFSCIAYGVTKMIILRNNQLEEEKKTERISRSKEIVYKNLFFFLYVTYLSTCSKTAIVLPPACRKLCRDDGEELCFKYLKADYRVPCQGQKYHHFLVVAFISTAYIFALPAASLIVLWKARLTRKEARKAQNLASNEEITSGLCFLFENYQTCSWYWELVEMTRKVVLTSGLILLGQESRSFIGLALVIAGMYGIVFSWVKPLQDEIENRLMTTSLAVTAVNLVIGAASKIPAENIAGRNETDTDALVFKMLVFAANFLVIGLLVVQYALHVKGHLQEWRKNPNWSFSCCLALFLPVISLQGDIRGLTETNVLKTQLQSGEFEMVTLQAAVQDSSAIDVTLEEGEQGDDSAMEVKNDVRHVAKKSNKCNQGTQTDGFFSLLTAADVKKR
ncbi:hypothetical protein ACROYT_G031166 [Oculina patagonica]